MADPVLRRKEPSPGGDVSRKIGPVIWAAFPVENRT